MNSSFSPSINIERDKEKSLHYIPTLNSRTIYSQIASGFESGLHSFNIIGTYGTGKSAFLMAFAKHLQGEVPYFLPLNGAFNGCQEFEFIFVVGEYKSFIGSLGEVLRVEPTPKKVLQKIQKLQNDYRKQNTCLVLIVDEFGKFLEYAATHAPDEELYFIQQIAEYANDASRNLLFLTTLHQNFDAYAIGLQEAQRREWEKVKGRLKELTFNEPVEQLLKLAADFISKENRLRLPLYQEALTRVILTSGVFKLQNEITQQFVEKLYPFDLLSAMVLTVALQRYGQNERSLFNFLQAEEHLGIKRFIPSVESPFYDLTQVYDYLIYNYYSTLTSRYNPDYFKWALIRNSLERVEASFSEDVESYLKLIKVIGLLNILGSDAGRIDVDLLGAYSRFCLKQENTELYLRKLEEAKVIHFQSFKKRYKLFEGTDIDIDQELRTARQEIDPVRNLVAELEGYFQLDYVSAKAVSYQTGTPRIFQYRLTENPLISFSSKNPEVDGWINLLFQTNDPLPALTDEPIIYGIFKNADALKVKLEEIKAVEKALTKINDDYVATRELRELKSNLVQELNDSLHQQLFIEEKSVQWFFGDNALKISNVRDFNKELSKIAYSVYKDAPIYRNELVNRTYLSSSISYARKKFLEALVNDWDQIGLKFPEKGMPPEKSIYYTLLKETGIHQTKNGVTAFFSKPEDPSFQSLWEASEAFLERAKDGKRPISEFIQILKKKPFGLKLGFIEFWVITFLFIKRDDYALFKESVYVPRLTKEVGELLMREAKAFSIKTFNIEGIKLDLFKKYQELTQQKDSNLGLGPSFQATARPFLLFYKQLPHYTKHTKNLCHDTIAFRNVIANAKELEKMFFEELPTAFGLNLNELAKSEKGLLRFTNRLQVSLAELRDAYPELIEAVEIQLLKILGYPKTDYSSYRTLLQQRYKGIKDHLLFIRQKNLLSRINAEMPDKNAWLNSIVQAVLGKQLDQIEDGEEQVLYDRLTTAFRELDDLTELSKEDFNEASEEALKVEITGFNGKTLKRNIILSKQQVDSVKALKSQIKKLFQVSGDDHVQRAAIFELLREMLDNGED